MKKLLIVLISVLLMTGCASTNPFAKQENPLEQFMTDVQPHVDTLAIYWPAASGAIRGAIGEENLPKSVVDDLEEIDSWFQGDDGTWIENIELNMYQKWYIAGVRISHTGPVLRALIQQYAPGLMQLTEVAAALAFLGLAL